MTRQHSITAAQMRALEQDAIASGRVTGAELMERAGAGVVEAILEEWPEFSNALGLDEWEASRDTVWEDHSIWSKRVVVLCGPGNNGGDGFVVARLLHDRGWHVDVFFYGDASRLSTDARGNYDAWMQRGPCRQLGFPELDESDADAFWDCTNGITGTPLVVDALFGLGINRPLTALQPILEQIEHFGFLRMGDHVLRAPRVVAVDVPSGMDSDTGAAPLCDPVTSLYYLAVHADLTVTFHARKSGHVSGQAAILCGKTTVKDVGL